jgi:hypothetical protein
MYLEDAVAAGSAVPESGSDSDGSATTSAPASRSHSDDVASSVTGANERPNVTGRERESLRSRAQERNENVASASNPPNVNRSTERGSNWSDDADASSTTVTEDDAREVGARSAPDKLFDAAEVRPAGVRIDNVDLMAADDGLLETEQTISVRRNNATLTRPFAEEVGESATTKNGFVLSVRKSLMTTPFVDNNARPVNEGLSENAALGGYAYVPEVGDGFSIGVELGNERVTQSLFHNRNDSIIIDQRPLLSWFAVGVGMEADLLDVPVTGRIALGGTFNSGGPMARASLGVDLVDMLPLGDNSALSFPVGLETSSFVYTYNGQYMISGNWGITAGVGYRINP